MTSDDPPLLYILAACVLGMLGGWIIGTIIYVLATLVLS